MSALPGLEDQVIAALRKISRAIDLHSRDLLQQIGLTAPQLAALRAIERLQPVSIGRLARSIHLSQATLTGILTRLEHRSLVTRTRSGSDRRSVVIELTETARDMLTSAPSLLQDRFRHKLLNLREWEQTQMLATLQRIAFMMHTDEMEASATPAGTREATELLSSALSSLDSGSAAAPLAGGSRTASRDGKENGKSRSSLTDDLETIS